jgi:hypothetical protein
LKPEVKCDGRIIINGPVSQEDYLFGLPLRTFKKGECIVMRGTLKNGAIGFGLLSSDRKKWMDINSTNIKGDFVLSLTAPEDGSYIPMVIDHSLLGDHNIDCEIADISIY